MARQYGSKPREESTGPAYSDRRRDAEPKPKEPDPSPSAEVVQQFHENSDLDKSRESQHHSLGLGPYNASPGDHNHTGGNSVPLFDGRTLTGSKGGNVALANLITILSAYGLTDNTS